jgi:hypothetical protein
LAINDFFEVHLRAAAPRRSRQEATEIHEDSSWQPGLEGLHTALGVPAQSVGALSCAFRKDRDSALYLLPLAAAIWKERVVISLVESHEIAALFQKSLRY